MEMEEARTHLCHLRRGCKSPGQIQHFHILLTNVYSREDFGLGSRDGDGGKGGGTDGVGLEQN